jgi:hypothetical protein
MSVPAWIALRPECVLNPLVFSALLAAGLGLCLYLFATLKVEIRGLLKRIQEHQRQIQGLEGALAEARNGLGRLECDLREIESQTGMLVEPAPARSGLNLSKRTQVLRRHRAGEDPAAIASALELPRAEVELLIKVQRLVLEKM